MVGLRHASFTARRFAVTVASVKYIIALTRHDRCPTFRCRASMKMSPFLLDRNVPLLKSETPIPSCDDYAACSGTRQDCPAARATAARGLDGTRRKPEPHIPYKREVDLLESATDAISIEVRMGTSNEARHTTA